MVVTEVIQACSVSLAAFSFIYGVHAWKRDFIGKRRIELAESVLALFYEAEEVIKEIRGPFSYSGEGTSRKKNEPETQEEAKLLDKAYVVFERYKGREKLFAELRSHKYRMMAVFGPSAGEPFVELYNIVNDIFIAAKMLGTYYWPRQGRVSMTDVEREKHVNQMFEYEQIVWDAGGNLDKIGPRVREQVENIENITEVAISSQLNFVNRLAQRSKQLATKLIRPEK